MATTARKLRKRHQRESGTHFIHTAKQGTPILERVVGPGQDHKGNPRPSVRQQKKLLRRLEVISPRPAQVDEQPPVELDPKPWRVGRKRYSNAEAVPILLGEDSHIMPSEIVFSPRKQYEQDHSKY